MNKDLPLCLPLFAVRRAGVITVLLILLLSSLAFQAGCNGNPQTKAESTDNSDVVCDTEYLASLRNESERQWKNGDKLMSLLTLEHACAVVVAAHIEEEGGHDYLIKVKIRELFEKEDYETLWTIMRCSEYFPQSSNWVWGWAEAYPDKLKVSEDLLNRKWSAQEANAALDQQLADELLRKMMPQKK